MQERVDNLITLLIDNIIRLETELLQVQEKNDEIYKLPQEFLNFYDRKSQIDFDILEKIIDKLNVNITLENYKNIPKIVKYTQESLKEYEQIKSSLEYKEKSEEYKIGLDHAIESLKTKLKKCNDIIQQLLYEVRKYNSICYSKIQKIGFEKRMLETKINSFKRTQEILEFYLKNNYIKEEDFLCLIEFIKENDDLISENDFISLIENIVKSNVNRMKSTIEIEILKQKKAQEKELEKQRIIEEQKEKELEKIAISSAKKEEKTLKPIKELSEHQIDLYYKASDIASIEYEIPSTVKALLTTLNSNLTLEQRKQRYLSLTSKYEQRILITLDLKHNIIPLVEKTEEDKDYELLEQILNCYEDTLSKEETKKEINLIECLQNSNMTKELELYLSTADIITRVQELITNNETYYGSEIPVLYQQIMEKYEFYLDALNTYFKESSNEYKECIDLIYPELLEIYKKINQEYKNIQLKNRPEDLIRIAEEFYEGAKPLRNIILFADDLDDETSIIESDIEEDCFSENIHEATLKCFKEIISDNFSANANHKAKGDYAEEFLKKYKVKAINNGESRILYSRFNTNLGNGDIHIVFIHSIGYGRIDKTQKSDVYKEALKRCYKNKNHIDYYQDLLKLDLETLSKEEKIKKQKEIKEYLRKQYIKLGHLISVCEEKTKKKSNRRGDNNE